jgi:hypothetical protein
MVEVTLSNDMCRQNLPSGIVTTISPFARVSLASIFAADQQRRRQQHDKDGGSDDGAGGRRAVIAQPNLRGFLRRRFRRRAVGIREPRRRL